MFRFLIVDDSEADALQISFLIEHEFSHVAKCEHASTRAEALDWLHPGRHQPFDAVLLDLGLPDSDGIETVRAIRAAAPDIAIVVWSGRNDTRELRDFLIDEGAAGYLEKGTVKAKQIFECLRDASELARTCARMPHEGKQVLDEAERRASLYVETVRRAEPPASPTRLQAEMWTSVVRQSTILHRIVSKQSEQIGAMQTSLERLHSENREQQEQIEDVEATGRYTIAEVERTKKLTLATKRKLGALVTAATGLGYAFGEGRESIVDFLKQLLGG